MDIKKILGANIKKYRKQNGYTQMKFAEILNVEQKHVSFIESGNSFPSAGLIMKIADVFGIPPKNLFEFAEPLTVEQLKQVMLLSELNDEDTLIYGKTGMGKDYGITADSWFTGFCKSDNKKVLFFSTRYLTVLKRSV